MNDAASNDDNRFRLAMASAGIGMAIVSLDGVWLDVNPALCRMLGYPAEALVGHKTLEFTHPEDLGITPMVLQALVSGGDDVFETEKRYLRADGSTVEVMAHAAVMRSDAGEPLYLIAQLNDVTARRSAERALQELNASLEQRVAERTEAVEAANRRLQTFAYGVSHDLRAPLRTIDAFANQLERRAGDGLDEHARDSLQRIRTASTRMGTLIDSLMELTRIGQVELRPASVDVSLVAEWAAAELQDAAPGRSAQVNVQQGLEMVGDERLLKILFTQLLRNAWQFSGQRPQVDVVIEGRRDGRSLQLAVRDQGIGFDMAYANKLFEPFQRLHSSEEGAGHGIGLTIAQQVVARHGGRIWAAAEPDHGATFHVTLHDLQAMDAQAA